MPQATLKKAFGKWRQAAAKRAFLRKFPFVPKQAAALGRLMKRRPAMARAYKNRFPRATPMSGVRFMTSKPATRWRFRGMGAGGLSSAYYRRSFARRNLGRVAK